MDSPIYPTVSQGLREPLATTTPPLTLNQVPRFQCEQSPGRQENSYKQQRIPWHHDIQPSSSWEQLFPSALLLASPALFTVTAHLFGLHGPTPKFGPKAVTRWKIGHNLHKPLPSPTPSLNTGFSSFFSDSISPTSTGTQIHRSSTTWNGKFIRFLLGNRQGQKYISIYLDLPSVTLPFWE